MKNNNTPIEAMKWRYAVKRMSGEVVANDKIDAIVEAIHLSPSSMGLQPYEIIMVTNLELKSQMLSIAFNQRQIIECSHILVFAVWDRYTDKRIDKAFNHLQHERNLPSSDIERQRISAKIIFREISDEANFHHAAKQAYIALGIATLTAALEGIDASPMEGFDAPALDELLGLKGKGLKSSVLLALGYRDRATDWSTNLKKVRKPINELLTFIN
jgi:nitroreductase / dihydropteridine reductase